MANKINKMQLSDGTEFDVAALLYTTVSENGNLEINSPTGKSINLRPSKHVKIKPNGTSSSVSLIEFDSEYSGDTSEVQLKVLCGATSKPVRFKINTDEVEFNKDDATDQDTLDITFKTGRSKPSTMGRDQGNEYYAQTRLKGRSIDLRCYEHGGIALQPCGVDNSGKENKIKFESARTNDITESTGTYGAEGGKGIEFGTFNTEKTSLFNNEYRFNENGIVYAVTRGTLTTNSKGKTDYPTQTDDFKDIKSTDLHKQAKWEHITQTAYSLNGGRDRQTKYTNGGNVEINLNTTYKWESVTTEPAEYEVLTITAPDTNYIYKANEFETLPTVNSFYKIGNNYYKFTKYSNPKLTINGEDELVVNTKGDISLNAGDDVVLNPTGAVKIQTPELRLGDARTVTANGMKITKKGALEFGTDVVVTTEVVNNANAYYDSTSGKVYILINPIYDAEGTAIDFTSEGWATKAIAYSDSTHETPITKSTKILVKNSDGEVWYCDVNKDSQLKEFGNSNHEQCTGTEYANTVYVTASTDIPATAVKKNVTGSTADSITVSISDIAKFINWAKTNNQGPWAE